MSPKYRVTATLNHDTTEYSPGDAVEMTEEQAGILQPLGVIGEEVQDFSDPELIELIKSALSVDVVDGLVGKIRRKVIVEAAAARKAELAV